MEKSVSPRLEVMENAVENPNQSSSSFDIRISGAYYHIL
jgi:hypothetical protein